MKIFNFKLVRLSTAFVLFSLFFNSCYDDLDDNLDPVSIELEIKDFIWKAMNALYLYKDEIPELSNDRFDSDEQYNTYLNGFDTPESLFQSLLFMPETVDRFSFLYDDYIEAEQQSDGIEMRTGIRLGIVPDPQNANKIHLLILEVTKGSPADEAGVKRGMIASTINGTELTAENVNSLIGNQTFTLGFSDYLDNGTESLADDMIVLNEEDITLTRSVFTDKSVNLAEIIEIDGQNVGYLVYNRFNINFEAELNEAFGLFKSANVQELIIDLRYNPGGQIITAVRLGSMITGQFNGQVFSKLVYNNELQELNEDFLFTNTIENDQNINSLGLEKVYVLTTNSSASASELIINSLDAYIDVVHIGTSTRGKTQASLLLYDSPNFRSTERNPRHTYVIQPLIANSINKNSLGVPGTGLIPDIEVFEIPNTYQIFDFGDVNERLLATAIADIRGSSRFRYGSHGVILETISDGKENQGGLIINEPLNILRKIRFNK